MARATIKVTKVTDVSKFQVIGSDADLWTALDTSLGGAADISGTKDSRLVLLAKNTSTDTDANVTIKAGNANQGVADEVIEVGHGETVALAIESGRFKNITGTDKGKVVLMGASHSVAVIALP